MQGEKLEERDKNETEAWKYINKESVYKHLDTIQLM